MPISALVVTLSSDCELSKLAVQTLLMDARVTVGERRKALLPIVIETATLSESAELAKQIEQTSGVTNVDLIGVDFSDAEL